VSKRRHAGAASCAHLASGLWPREHPLAGRIIPRAELEAPATV